MLTRLVLAVIWLWMVRFLSVSADSEKEDEQSMTNSSKGNTMAINETTSCYSINDVDGDSGHLNTVWLMCTSDVEMYSIMINCYATDNCGNLSCYGTHKGIDDNQYDTGECKDTSSPTMPPRTTSEVESVTCTSSEPSQSNCSYESTMVAALGVVVGLLIALQIVTTTSLIWTCWAMKRRQGVNISRKDRNGVEQLTNPTYAEGDNVLSLQPATSPTAMPAYETIALNPRVKVTTSEKGEHNYHVLERGQGSSSCTGGGLETIREDELESSYSKLQLAEKEEESGGVKKEQNHQYGNLEMLELDMVTVDEPNSGRQESGTVINGENGGLQLESIDAGIDNGEKDMEMESQNDDVILLTTTTTDNTGTDTTRNSTKTGGLKPSTSLEIIHP